MPCHAYADILSWMPEASLALQTDQDGKSFSEAANANEELLLKLATLQTLHDVLEKSILELLNTANNVNKNHAPQFGR